MMAARFLKKTAYLLGALLLVACQPSAPTAEPSIAENSEALETPVIVSKDSVTLTSDHILSIKASRYQPSLGLQGSIEPIKQTQLIAARALSVEQVLVTKSQWVEKGDPLMIVRRQVVTRKQTSTNPSNKTAAEADLNAELAQPISNIRATTADTMVADDANLAPSKNPTLASADHSQVSSSLIQADKLITVRASFSGRVDKLYAEAGQQKNAGEPLLQLSDETDLHFIATLPIQAKPQLSVGQTVNFTADGLADKFTGQLSKLMVANQNEQLLVYVNVIDDEASRHKLLPNMQVIGRVNYGQIEVGAIVPERALHDVDLTPLKTPPYKPLSPLSANVWTIKQDQRLTRQPIEVIEYDPSTKQYLIAGVSNDSLICLADLPIEAAGKKVVVS